MQNLKLLKKIKENEKRDNIKRAKIRVKILDDLFSKIFTILELHSFKFDEANLVPETYKNIQKFKNLEGILDFAEYILIRIEDLIVHFNTDTILSIISMLKKIIYLNVRLGLLKNSKERLYRIIMTVVKLNLEDDSYSIFLLDIIRIVTKIFKMGCEYQEEKMSIYFIAKQLFLQTRIIENPKIKLVFTERMVKMVKFYSPKYLFGLTHDLNKINFDVVEKMFGLGNPKISDEHAMTISHKFLKTSKMNVDKMYSHLDLLQKFNRKESNKNVINFLEFLGKPNNQKKAKRSQKVKLEKSKIISDSKIRRKIIYFMKNYLKSRQAHCNTNDCNNGQGVFALDIIVSEKNTRTVTKYSPFATITKSKMIKHSLDSPFTPIKLQIPVPKTADTFYPISDDNQKEWKENAENRKILDYINWVTPKIRKFGKIEKWLPCKLVIASSQMYGIVCLSDTHFGFFGGTKKTAFLNLSLNDDDNGMEDLMEEEMDEIGIDIDLLDKEKMVESEIWNCCFRYWKILQIFPRKIFLEGHALELFVASHGSFIVVLKDKTSKDELLKSLSVKTNLHIETDPVKRFFYSGSVKEWQTGAISNFEFLLRLNTFSGRTFNDVTQYPVFPWIIRDYKSESINLSSAETFRDLSKPMGALNADSAKETKKRFEEIAKDNKQMPPFHYGTMYSSAAIVLEFLMRLEPYTEMYTNFHDGNFDLPDRIFFSIESSWNLAATSISDVRELIPEFFNFPEIFKNVNGLNFGNRQDGSVVNDVILPPWAKSAEEFVSINRAALESDFVSNQLHKWVDLIFGYKQMGSEAEKAQNVFHHLMYHKNENFENIKDENLKEATKTQISNFGQVPIQILKTPCPKKMIHSEFANSPTRIIFERNTFHIGNIDDLKESLKLDRLVLMLLSSCFVKNTISKFPKLFYNEEFDDLINNENFTRKSNFSEDNFFRNSNIWDKAKIATAIIYDKS
ncbi:WD repeat and FYVE domain-containing protein 3, variant 2, partial [Bonamia ostreae]